MGAVWTPFSGVGGGRRAGVYFQRGISPVRSAREGGLFEPSIPGHESRGIQPGWSLSGLERLSQSKRHNCSAERLRCVPRCR